MPKLPEKACTGCTACVHVCPVHAIAMREDAEGFLRPSVEAEVCVECGKCEKTCPMNSQRDTDALPEYGVFAAKAKDEQVHQQSQSGGVFYLLAQNVLENGGTVYGAVQNAHFETEHIRVDAISQLPRLQGVKYVQSRLGEVFPQVAEDLNEGKNVLFSGTPCQVAGLRAYLKGKKSDDKNLLTVDLVCYGVPSPGVFGSWVSCLEKTYHSKLERMYYRRTDAKWGKGKEYYRMANGKVLEGSYYTSWYFRNLIIRPSCESCQFCNSNRCGDITVGDFWGIEKCAPEFYDDRGVSVVFCSTEKGRNAFFAVAGQLEMQSASVEAAIAAQPRLQNIPVKASSGREGFWKEYRQNGISFIAMREEMIPPSMIYRIRRKYLSLKQKLTK